MSEIFGQSCIIKNQQAKAEDHITFILQGNTNLPLYLAAMHKIWRYYRFVHTEVYEKNGKHINVLFCFVLMTQICRKAVFCTLKDADQFFYFPKNSSGRRQRCSQLCFVSAILRLLCTVKYNYILISFDGWGDK